MNAAEDAPPAGAAEIIKRLAGMPITGLGRAADLIWCAFGKDILWRNYKGELVEKPEFSLHFQCPMRITQGGRLLLGSADLQDYLTDESRSRGEMMTTAETLFDLKSEELNRIYWPSLVISAEVNALGDVTIGLDSGLKLEAFVTSTTEEESWRVLGFADPRYNFVFPEDRADG